MPEATVLYSVTAVVVAALVVWVAFVLSTAKEPWVRAVVRGAPAEVDGPSASGNDASSAAVPESVPAIAEAAKQSVPIDADSTARATPLALANRGKPGKTTDES